MPEPVPAPSAVRVPYRPLLWPMGALAVLFVAESQVYRAWPAPPMLMLGFVTVTGFALLAAALTVLLCVVGAARVTAWTRNHRG